MEKSFTIASFLAIFMLTGCGEGTRGGAGVTDTTAKKPVFGQTEDTFNLSVPMMATSLQQGGKLETQIGIERARNFGEDVMLTFTGLPEGVKVLQTAPEIKHGDANARITFSAEKNAVIGDYKIKVAGRPEKGEIAEIEFKLNITAIDTFTLSTPVLSTTVKQNESSAVSIGVRRDKLFTSDVQLMFAELPTGVTMTPAKTVVTQENDELEVTLTAAADAALGDFTVKVTGHPTVGEDVSRDLKLSVVKD